MLYRRLLIEWLVVVIAASLLVIGSVRGRWTAPLDNILLDSMTLIRPANADDRIMLVEIDESSLARIGTWPWPRSVHASALEMAAKARPAAIGYDVLFIEPTAEDARFAEGLRAAAPVYLPMLPGLPDADGRAATTADQKPPPPISAAAAGLGSVDVNFDDDGVVRRFEPRLNGAVPHLTELLVRRIDPQAYQAHPPAMTQIIPFQRPGAFRRVSFDDLQAGRVPDALIRGKVLLFGGIASGFGDRFLVPFSAGTLMSGVELQANMLNALLHGDFYHAVGTPWVTAFSLLPVLLLLLAFLHFGPMTNLRLSLAGLGVVSAASVGLLLTTGWWVPPGSALLGLVVVYSLWGWRRLAAVSEFLTAEVVQLQKEPDLVPAVVPASGRGDLVNVETNRLHDVIAQLRALRAFIAEILARLPDAVCVVDDDGTVVMGNIAADRLFGRAVRDQPLLPLLAGIGLGGAVREGEVTLPDGRTLVLSRAVIDGIGTIMRFADITELKAASRAREEALQFLSHDMRAPFSAVIALLQDRTSGDSGAVTAETALRIRQHAGRGLQLADDFVQLARLENASVVAETVDLAGALAEAIDLVWQRARQRNVAIRERIDDDDLWVMGDPALVQRALLNLLGNAVKFAPEGGTVECHIVREGALAACSITGQGPPMPPERARDPFIPFAPGTDAAGEASRGLGLAFVRMAAERQNGSVGYREMPDGMKEFTIRLPLATDD